VATSEKKMRQQRSQPRPAYRWLWSCVLTATLVVLVPEVARGQTDYYNLDTNRPVLIEDAYPTERFAFELQLAPVR